VVWDTKRDRVATDEVWTSGHELPVFVLGGGAKNLLHRSRVDSLGPWLRHHSQNNGIRIRNLPKPANIDLPEPTEDFDRLAVAWGLSYLPTEIGRFRRPSEIENVTGYIQTDRPNPLISKDHV
jgi:hypothetical protein